MVLRHARAAGAAFAVLLVASNGAQAQTPSDPRNQCGALSGPTATPPNAVTCGDMSYGTGIRYDAGANWNQGVDSDVAVTVTGGTGGTPTTITAPSSPANGWTDDGIVVRTSYGSGHDIALTVGTDGNAVAIARGSTATSGGIYVHQPSSDGAATTVTVGSGVTIGSAAAPVMHYGINTLVETAANTGDHAIVSAAAIHSTDFGILMDARGSGNVMVTNSGSIATAATGGNANEKSGIRVLDWSGQYVDGASTHGDDRTAATETAVTNSGSIAVSAANAHGIHVDADGLGLYRVANSGTVSASGAGGHGIYVDARRYRGVADSETVRVENSGAIRAPGAGSFGIYVEANGSAGSGAIAVENKGPIASANHAIIVNADTNAVTVTNSGDLTVSTGRAVFARSVTGNVAFTHSAGEIRGVTGPAIGAWIGRWRNEGDPDSPDPEGAADVRVEIAGGSVRASETLGSVAVEALNNEGGSVTVEISGGATLNAKHNAAVFAALTDRQNASGRIAVVQGGRIDARRGVYAMAARGTTAETARAGQPLIDVAWTGTFREVATAAAEPRNISHAVGVAQESQAGAAFRGETAGIDAQVMSWRAAMAEVAASDDPGEIADAARQTELVPTGATAADNAYVRQFRAALGNDEFADAFIDAIGSAAATADDVTDAEIVTYLQMDDADRRTLLRNVLAQGFSDEEEAALRAVAAGDGAGLTNALIAAGHTSTTGAYRTAVEALLLRRNPGDIRIRMTGGMIDSHGDGIRAWYATPHAGNGSIDVRVADGATVTGGAAGIWVSNAGAGADGILKQAVTVNGTVTGGTDAAVHLVGGGRLTVGETGRVLAGSSGRAIRVNDPGPAEIDIHGTVRGGPGAAAAVHLTGGGSVVVHGTGSVDANGAEHAIRGDNAPTRVAVLQASRFGGGLTQEGLRDAAERLGTVGGDNIVSHRDREVGKVTVAVLETHLDRPTGFYRALELDPDGKPIVPEPDLPDSFACDWADGRCRLYEALPSMLLAMNGLPTYGERMAAARDGNGGWARVDGAGGEWKAKSSTQPDMAFDYRRYGVHAGVDFAVGGGRFGVSARGLQGSAEMPGSGGEIELSGVGAGAHATAFPGGGIHVDAQAMATWYDVRLTSGRNAVLKDGAKALGLALGVEVGRRIDMGGGVAVTPAAGLAWSDASLDFSDAMGTLVSVEDARSLQGRAGLRVEARTEGGLRLSGSVEATREFSDERTAKASGEALKTTEAERTGVRVGLGGARIWGDGRYALRVSAGYAARGSGNGEFDGGIGFAYRH